MKPEQEGRWRMEAKLFTFPLWAPGNRIGPGCWNSDFPRSETVWVPLQDNWFDTWLWLKYDLKWLWSLVWGCRLVIFNPKCYLDSKSTRNQSPLAVTMVSVWLSCFFTWLRHKTLTLWMESKGSRELQGRWQKQLDWGPRACNSGAGWLRHEECPAGRSLGQHPLGWWCPLGQPLPPCTHLLPKPPVFPLLGCWWQQKGCTLWLYQVTANIN